MYLTQKVKWTHTSQLMDSHTQLEEQRSADENLTRFMWQWRDPTHLGFKDLNKLEEISSRVLRKMSDKSKLGLKGRSLTRPQSRLAAPK